MVAPLYQDPLERPVTIQHESRLDFAIWTKHLHWVRVTTYRFYPWTACLWLALLLGESGCTAVSSTSIDTIKLAVHGRPKIDPTAAEVNAKPYYQLKVSAKTGEAILVLGNLDGAREAWYGKNQVVVFLEHGRLVQTVGLPYNLDHMQLPADDPLARGLQHLSAATTYQRTEDWSPGYRYGVPVTAQLIPVGQEQIDILGVPHNVLHVDEQLSAPLAHYHAVNHYWVDLKDGFIWKSEQQVTPEFSLTLLQLRPYRGKSS